MTAWLAGDAMVPDFLRIPPFPFAAPVALAHRGSTAIDAEEITALLARNRVGGRFWGIKPVLPEGRDIVLAPADARQLSEMLAVEPPERVALLTTPGLKGPRNIPLIDGRCDLWALAAQCRRVRGCASRELSLVAAIEGCEVAIHGEGPFARAATDLPATITELIGSARYQDPFTGDDLSAPEAVRLLGGWRQLLDRNALIEAVLGVAGWKRRTVDPLLWDGIGPVPHRSDLPAAPSGDRRVLAWQARTRKSALSDAAARGLPLGEIEDGFIRSVGLGADCVPPLSVVVDWQGIYFDPSRPSDLESILADTVFDDGMLLRAAALRERIVRGAISKYASGAVGIRRVSDGRRRVLVTGQVEDDRSIQCGGESMTNLALLRRARELEPDAWLIYKPHPDVEAGHRKGDVPPDALRRYADEVERDAPIAPLLDSVEAVHVITSLAGFEALLRGKSVTTHGMPFFAGWGLTRDLAAVPARRKRRLSLDELVAGTLLSYPRYLDPVTGLPCNAEVLIDRLETDRVDVRSMLVTVRRMQGQLQRAWRKAAGVVR